MRTYPKSMRPSEEEIHALAQRFRRAAGKRIALTAATADLVAHALRRYADDMSRPAEFEYGLFRVEVIGPYRVDKIQVVSRDRQICDAAFDILVCKNPEAKVQLLHSMRVLKSYESGKVDGT